MKLRRVLLVLALLLVSGVAAQAQDLEAAVLPENLVRLSWGAIFAGVIIALVTQMALNILGIAVGMNTIKPHPRPGEDVVEPQTFGTGAMVWIAVSSLLALFFGGWLAARFSGTPNEVDGILHGVMVWGLTTIITVFLLSTSIGRLMSGLSSLTGQILMFAQRAVGTTVQVAGQAARTTASAAGSVANAAGSAVKNTAQGAANAAGSAANAAQNAAGSAANAAQDAARQANPQVQVEAERRFNLSTEQVREELRALLRDANIPQEELESRMQSVGEIVREEARQALQNPSEAGTHIQHAFDRILIQANEVLNETDRNDLVRVLAARTDMSEQQARETISKWENRLQEARQQVQDTRRNAEQQMKINQAGAEGAVNAARDYAEDRVHELEQRVNALQDDFQHRFNRVRYETEEAAREAAEDAAKTVARLAAAIFVALVIGLASAGFGGWVGAPDDLPVADIGAVETLPDAN